MKLHFSSTKFILQFRPNVIPIVLFSPFPPFNCFFPGHCVSLTLCDASCMMCPSSHTRPSLSIWFSFSLLACCSLRQRLSPCFSSCIYLLRVIVFIASDTPRAGQTLNFSVLFNQCSALRRTSQYKLSSKTLWSFPQPLGWQPARPKCVILCSSSGTLFLMFHTAFRYWRVWGKINFPCVLLSIGVELHFFIVACTGLCFGFVPKITLISH